MSIIISTLLRILAGMGIAWGFDKVLPDKVPDYQPVFPGFNLKTVFLVVAMLAGALLLVFLGKKFKIKIFK